MLRKITALVLVTLIVMTSFMSELGLRYCLCLDKVFVGQCECLDVTVPDNCSSFNETPDACTPSCSHGCSEATSTEDCIVDLAFNLDNCVPSDIAYQYIALNSRTTIPTPTYRRPPNGTRGSPPTLLVVSSVPIYVRHLVFLV